MSDLFRNAGTGGAVGPVAPAGSATCSAASSGRTPAPAVPVRPRARRGADVETEVRIAFADAVTGVTVPLGITERTTCPTCHGVGARPGTAPRDCPVCKGTGLTTRNQGSFAFSEPCSNCHGTGSIIDDPCPTCHGERTVVHSRRLTTRIPAGVADGQRIKLAGKGEPGFSGGPAGDLFVVVHVSGHELFGRNGDNLTLSVPVTFPELVAGHHAHRPDAVGCGESAGAGRHLERTEVPGQGRRCATQGCDGRPHRHRRNRCAAATFRRGQGRAGGLRQGADR